MEVPSGSVVDFRTRDLWDHPDPGLTQPWDGEDGAFAPIPDADLNFDKAYGDLAAVHIITGPVGVAGAMPGDKLAIEILDITPLAQGFTMSHTPLGFMNGVKPDGNSPEEYKAWVTWDYDATTMSWTSPSFPDVVVPYEPFPGSIGVLPSAETVALKLEHHATEVELYGNPQWAVNPELAVPAAVCGVNGTHATECLRTLAGGEYFGNTDTQRMGVGTTLLLECEVAGCGVGTGDVHGAQGDGEVSITAIEMAASVKMKLTLVKPGDAGYATPTPAMYGTTSIKRMSPGEFISFMGFPFKSSGTLPSQYVWAKDRIDTLVTSKIIPESMSLAGANALLKALTFLMEVGGYTYGEAMILAPVTVDLRVDRGLQGGINNSGWTAEEIQEGMTRSAQLVDKPAVGMEAVIDLTVFKGAKYAAFKQAAAWH